MARCRNPRCSRDSPCAPGCPDFPYDQAKQEYLLIDIDRKLDALLSEKRVGEQQVREEAAEALARII